MFSYLRSIVLCNTKSLTGVFSDIFEPMSRFFFSILCGLYLLGCSNPSTPPNVVLILADDLGFGDVGSYNADSAIPTPYMDALAADGMRFTDAHSPSGVCTPTRYGLLTGRYAWRHPQLGSGVTWGYDPLVIDTNRVTIADIMSDAGYRTAVIGKWHLGLGSNDSTHYHEPLVPGPLSLGFDYFYGIPASLDMDPYVWVENESVTAPPDEYAENPEQCCANFWRSGAIASDFVHEDVLPVIAQRTSDYIRSSAGEDAPFFLYVPLPAPHTPWLTSEEFLGTSDAGIYGDFVVMVDDAIGQIMAALEETDQVNETLFIVTSDNGAYWPPPYSDPHEHLPNYTWRGMKADIHEGGHRIPLIARWPSVIEAGSKTDQLTVHTDFFATLADITQTNGQGQDSHSLYPVFLGEKSTRSEAIHQSIDGILAIRQGDWKLIDGQGSGGFTNVAVPPNAPPRQLYNLDQDPAEGSNLYETYPEIAENLLVALDSARSQ